MLDEEYCAEKVAEHMIAGISYNVFNAEEHLVSSLLHSRQNAEYINLVVQFTSNVGLPASSGLQDVLHEVQRKKLVDDVSVYVPDFDVPPAVNEHRKRLLGLELAKKAGVSHFMTMDCDEYYRPSEFRRAREIIEERGVRVSAVRSYLHIKRPIWRSREPDTTCCAFLTAIDRVSNLELNGDYPCLVDPTRRLNGGEQPYLFFEPDTVAMYHMNLVRHDLSTKLKNSSNAHLTDFMARVQHAYDTWRFGEPLRFPNKPELEIVAVDDTFHIDHIFA